MTKNENPPRDKSEIPNSNLAVRDPSQELVEEILQAFPKTKSLDKGELAQIVQVVTQHSGPLPSPLVLRQYGDIIPDGVNRIVTMAESDQAHIHNMQILQMRMDERNHDRSDKALSGDQSYRILGLVFGFISLTVMLGIATFLIISGHDTAGGWLGGTTILGVVSAFIIGQPKAQMKADTAEKAPKTPSPPAVKNTNSTRRKRT